MEEILQKIIEIHELNVLKYTQEHDERNAKMKFMREHKYEKEHEHLFTQIMATNDMLYDYKNAINDLRIILDDWKS